MFADLCLACFHALIKKSFPYQRVQVDTQTLVFDDVSRHFDFERLFSVITEGITLEKKNKDEIHIPFESSPKIVITTNYAIKGAGNSFERRKWDLEFKQYYSKMFTPETEFGLLVASARALCPPTPLDESDLELIAAPTETSCPTLRPVACAAYSPRSVV